MKIKPNRLITTILIPILMAITTLTVEANDMTQIDVATKYYQALYSGNYSATREFASADMVFKDPTVPKEYDVPSQLNTLDEFIDLFKANLNGEVELNFLQKFVSNDQVVLRVEMTGTYSAEILGMGDGLAETVVQGISVLHVVDDKVVSHTDYIDYAGMKVKRLND